MNTPAEQPSAPLVDPTAHRPGDCCEHCDVKTFLADPTTCPGWLGHRTTQMYRVEGWDDGAWVLLSLSKPTAPEAEWHMTHLKARFPELPMRVVAETTSYMVVRTAPAQTEFSEGDQVT